MRDDEDVAEEPQPLIGFRTAMILYGLLAVVAFATLRRGMLYLALIVLGAAAVKTYVHHLRQRLE